MPDRLRWGLLGTARINRAILPRLKELPRHSLVAVASRDPARASAYAVEWDIPHACPSYDALLARDDVDVVFIPLPNAMHAEWTIRAADAGKHVLCEKPLALSVTDVDAIAQAAARNGVRIAEAFMYRHHPQTARVRQIVSQGDLGDLRLVRGCFCFTLGRPGDIRWQPGLGGGALWDVGCYPVSFARMALGREPREAFAVTEVHEGGVDLSCDGLLRFDAGRVAMLACSYRAAPFASIDLVGTDAVLHVPTPFKPGPTERLVLRRAGEEVELRVEGEPLYQGEIEEMADQVRDGAPPRIPLEDSRGNVAALVALHRSAAEGRPVPVAGASV